MYRAIRGLPLQRLVVSSPFIGLPKTSSPSVTHWKYHDFRQWRSSHFNREDPNFVRRMRKIAEHYEESGLTDFHRLDTARSELFEPLEKGHMKPVKPTVYKEGLLAMVENLKVDAASNKPRWTDNERESLFIIIRTVQTGFYTARTILLLLPLFLAASVWKWCGLPT